MALQYKPNIDQIRPYEPGKPIEEVRRELGLRRVYKLASNENPLGASPKAQRAIKRAARSAYLYPDGGGFYLKKRLAEKLGVGMDEIILGNGSNEIIELAVRGFVSSKDKVVSSEKAFLVYPLAVAVEGAQYIETPMQDFKFDLTAIADEIDKRTKLVFIANPNNPTGTYVTRKELTDFLDEVPENVVVCIDEAYFDFVSEGDYPDGVFYVKVGRPNVIVCRTFSKSYGLAGLRIGYAVASRSIVNYLNKIRQPFNVNRLAQEAACAALDDDEFLEKSKEVIEDGRNYLFSELNRLPLEYVRGVANFILIDLQTDAKEAFDFFLRKGVVIRNMSAYGFDTFIRVSVGLAKENKKFIKILKKFLKQRDKKK